MSFVLDTNVVSALRVAGRHPLVEEWARAVPVQDLFVTAMTISEIERGIVSKESTDARQGEVLRRWFEDRVLPAFAGRVLPYDLGAARVLATLATPARAPLDDAMIGAVAISRDMVLVTRNVKHVEPLGVPYLNPWEQKSGPT